MIINPYRYVIGGGGGRARRFWRIYVSANNGYTYTIFGGCEMRATLGGADQTSGGSAFTSSLNSEWPPIKAFDGTPPSTTNHDGWATKAGDSPPQFCGYIFASAVSVNQITMRSSGWTTYTTAAPRSFTIQSSADSTTGLDGTWDDEWTVTGQTGWTAGEVRTFTRP